MTTFDIAACLLLLAAAIGLLNDRWFGLPRNLALLIGALLASCLIIFGHRFLPFGHDAAFWRQRMQTANLSGVLLDGVLALLLFAGSMHVDPRALRERAWPVALLATGSVIVATVLFGAGFHAVTLLVGHPVPLVWCCVLGAILAPTDAVAVEGLLHHAPLPARLRATIAGESLFNDGAAVVLVLASLAVAGGQADVIGHGHLLTAIAIEVAGGSAIGWVAGAGAAWLSRRLKDRSLELTLSLAVALGTYRVATACGVSGPIAVVVSGLAYRKAPWVAAGTAAGHAAIASAATSVPGSLPGHPTAAPMTRDAVNPAELTQAAPANPGDIRDTATHVAASQPHVTTSWSVIDDLLNTFLFLLMGFQLLAVDLAADAVVLLPLGFLVALLARAPSVSLPLILQPLAWRVRARNVAVLTWTGLRGGISIALALTLPPTPYRDLLLATGYGIVIMTVVLQGLSVGPVLRWLYAAPADAPPAPPALPRDTR